MKVLFIGGTGIISSACSKLAVQQGIDLYLLNRGQSIRPLVDGASVLHGDIRDPKSARAALAHHSFDVVVDFVAFTPEHIETDLDLFRGRTFGKGRPHSLQRYPRAAHPQHAVVAEYERYRFGRQRFRHTFSLAPIGARRQLKQSDCRTSAACGRA